MRRKYWWYERDFFDWIIWLLELCKSLMIILCVCLVAFMVATLIAVIVMGSFQIWECVLDPLCRFE